MVDGDALEYTGTGAELFLGFLLFLALVSPFGLVWALLKVFAADPQWQVALTLGFYAFLMFFLVPVAMFRARRYRMSRTRWRGIRGGMTGSTLRFLGITLAGFCMTALSCGILAPWMRIRQTRYITNCSSFGDRSLSFDGKAGGLILRWLPAVAVPLGILVLAHWSVARYLPIAVAAGGQQDPKAMAQAALVGAIPVFLGLLAFGIGFVWYSVYEFRYTLNHTSIGTLRLQSRVEPWTIVGYVVAFFVLGGIAFAIFIGLVVAVFAGLAAALTHGDKEAGGTMVIVALLGVYLVALVSMSILRVLILDKAIVRVLVDSAALTGAEGLATIGQSTVPMPGSGEGMADALDLGAF